MQDLKELVKDTRKALSEVKTVAKPIDELKTHDLEGAWRELNGAYSELLVDRVYNGHIPRIAALADAVCPTLDEYITVYQQAVNDLGLMQKNMDRLAGLDRTLKEFQAKNAEAQGR